MAEIKVLYDGPVVSQAEAKAAGLAWYFSGKPCRYGHIAQKKTVSKACYGCRQTGRRTAEGRQNVKIDVHSLPKSWREAQSTGAKHYFTGTPCKWGHISAKLTSTSNCVECAVVRLRRWQAEHPEVTQNTVAKTYAERHPDRVKARQQAWWASGDGPEWQRRWRTENPEKVIEYRHTRRYREKAGGSFTAEEFSAVVKAQRHRCAYCPADLRKVRPSPDHIVPVSAGGSNRISNIQATCFPCNRRKNRRDPIEYAQSLGKLL